ncbi:unnamed protein product [Fraxinus pennsylvanica]|uniref:Uncharacterized protein n=1 Tax=Fraxinus pennsylvanica TaxID=56036 RepID=A0AAD2DVP7_9LAMI|nr:unnamed protein product [Fraxinus pennsylvanica]
MFSCLGNTASTCLRPSKRYANMNRDDDDDDDDLGGDRDFLLWCRDLERHSHGLAREKGAISEDTLRNAFSATENGFPSLVRRATRLNHHWQQLVCVVWSELSGRGHYMLLIWGLGDTRAVLGYLGKSNKIVAEQLTWGS